MPVVPPPWRQYLRLQDFVWLLLFSVLAVFSPERHPVVLASLVAAGVVQVIEPRLGALTAIVLKLLLCGLVIGYGGGVSSSLYLSCCCR